MRGFRSVEYYYTSPSSDTCAVQTRTQQRIFKKPSPISWLASDIDFALPSDIDFALASFDCSRLFEDFFSSGNKWLTQVESSFKAIEKESFPLAITDCLAMETRRNPLGKTVRRLRSTAVQKGGYSYEERVAEIHCDRDEFLHDLADRIAAMEVSLDKLMYSKATKTPLPPPSNVEKSFKQEWQTENGGKAKFSYKYEAKSLADGEFKTVRTEKCKVSKGTKKLESSVRVTPEKSESSVRLIPLEDDDEYAEASQKLQSVFVRKRAAAIEGKGKQKELSPMDAALIIQTRFREYLVHRSQNLRSLRDLAIAKAKLKELRSLFTNYGYRRHLCRDAEEKQRFSEKLIVLLLTVDSIRGSDKLVREARRSMIQELESMLDTIAPETNKGECSSRRKFDLPDPGAVHKEMEMEVAEVVGMLDEKNGGNLFPYVANT